MLKMTFVNQMVNVFQGSSGLQSATAFSDFQCGIPSDKPAMENGSVIICQKKRSPDAALYGSNCTEDLCFEDTCPSGHYCRAYFLSYDQAGAGQGFCCPLLSPSVVPVKEPICPVGQRHPSSKSPIFGCNGCPLDTHICFQDTRSSNLPTCCPNPCAKIGDVFIDGACFKQVTYGGPCTHDQNCKSAGAWYEPGEHMKCIGTTPESQVCGCSEGLFHLFGKCQGTA